MAQPHPMKLSVAKALHQPATQMSLCKHRDTTTHPWQQNAVTRSLNYIV